jgi:hypothetical protein
VALRPLDAKLNDDAIVVVSVKVIERKRDTAIAIQI